MESVTSDAHTHVEPVPSMAMPSATAKPLNIRWGRTFFALLGLIALLTAGISGALNVFNMGSAGVTWTSLAVFAAVIVALRTMAVRDQVARQAARLAARTTAKPTSAESATTAVELKEPELFDRAEGAEPAPAAKPLTAEELRAAAMRVAAKGSADAKLAHTQTLDEGELGAEPWEPVEVPTPGYVTANRALTLEKPLILPEAPKSAGTSIRADLAGVGVPGEHEGVVVVVDSPDIAAEKAEKKDKQAAAAERGAHALTNLDDVLQRRRA